MRKMSILLALVLVTMATTSGCTRCRNLFRRGAPCGGTTLAAPPMLGGAIPLGSPVAVPQAAPMVQPGIIAQPNCCCEQAPICVPCDPCPTECVPCEGGYMGSGAGYVSGDCECETAPGEYFGGYIEGSAPITGPGSEGTVVPQGSGAFPTPGN